jgi:two-component system response regulator PilR (NtrC family)
VASDLISGKERGQMKRILIVDDEPLIRFSLSRALKGLAEVETADTGSNANARITSCFYDICFLDICLPDINGLDIMREISRKSPETKVVIMTAYADDSVRKKIDKEAYRFLEKPLDLSQVKAIVQHLPV